MKILGIQFNSIWQDSEANLAKLKALFLERVKGSGADLVVLPETFHAGFSMQPIKFAESVEGEISQALASLALEYNVNIVAGVAQKQVRQECHGQSVKFFNRALLFDRNGILAGEYSKQKLFSYAGEDKAFQAGHNSSIVEIDGESFALLICYDLRFPELFRKLAKKVKGFIVIANWPDSRQQHWESLLKARAIENQCFIIAVNRTGSDDNGLSYSGGSCLISPMGEVLGYANSQEDIFKAEIDLNEVKRVRAKFPFLEDL